MRERAVLVSGFLLYTTFWSYVSLSKLYSLRATVFDLGVNMQYAWEAAHSVSAFPHFLASRGLVYLVAPVFLAGGFPAVLVFQSAFIGAGVFPLYYVARDAIGRKAALPLALSYLVYFPVSGMNWYDFHYQALFPTLFLFGWYFFRVRADVPLAFLFFALSALSHYPYSVFTGLLGLVLLNDSRHKVRGALPLALSLIVFSGFTLLLAVFTLGAQGATTGALAIPGVRAREPLYDALTLVLILAPVLFLPLVSRWSLFLLPYVALLAISNNPNFAYPFVFQLQYPALFVAFVFLGALDGVVKIGRNAKGRVALALLVLLSVSAFGVFLDPYGPLNQSRSYSLSGLSLDPVTRYRALEKELSLVKPGSLLLVENDMPEAFPGKNGTLPVDTLYITSNFLNKSHPDYVLADLNSSWYTGPGLENVTMQSVFDSLWESGNYSLVAEAYGVVLIERGAANLSYYVPERANYSAFSFYAPGAGREGAIAASYTGTSPHISWYGPYTYLEPGLFNITFELEPLASSGSLLLQVTADYGSSVLAEYPLNVSALPEGRWSHVSFEFYAPGAYSAVEFRGLSSRVNGTVLFGGVSLVQVQAGLPRFPDAVYPASAFMHPALERMTEQGLLNLTGAEGIVWYGPYATLPPGNYTLVLTLYSRDASGGQGFVFEVTADSGHTVLAEEGVNATALRAGHRFTLTFSTNRTYRDVEFRGISGEPAGSMYFAGVTLLRTDGAEHGQRVALADPLATGFAPFAVPLAPKGGAYTLSSLRRKSTTKERRASLGRSPVERADAAGGAHAL